MADRPERVPAEEVRQRMLDAGRELALEAGAALTIEHLLLEEVIQRARVPRSSVYRLWPHREDYIDDLLCYLAGPGSWYSDRPVLTPETFTVISELLGANTALLSTPAGRRALLREIVRITIASNYASLTESTPWRLQIALIATLGSTRGGEARKRIAAALEEAQRRSRDSMVAVLAHLAGVLGLRLRDPAYTLDHVQLAAGLVIQSLAMRNVQVQAAIATPDQPEGDSTADPPRAPRAPRGPRGPEIPGVADAQAVSDLLNTPLPGPGLHGGPADWTLAAHSYLGVLDSFMELDPDFTPPGS